MHESQPFPAPRLTLTIAEALRVTGLGRTTLYKLIGSGRVRRAKVGKRTLIRYDDLQKLVAPEDCAMPLRVVTTPGDISRLLADIATAPDEAYIVDLVTNSLEAITALPPHEGEQVSAAIQDAIRERRACDEEK